MASEAGAQLFGSPANPYILEDITFTPETVEQFEAFVRADEREACANEVGEFAKKWWSIHCADYWHMETTRQAHEDFCALQAAIRARGNT
jgi:hypothetical protein